ncbi:Putative peptidoglycan binding domain-containing protein [Actinomyces denticolens]|uniref:Peptidoglycan binding domain-containing protein n=1 Tax=Actinomyces denticolens TaxID=52767 RepID=A0ABY1IFS0_9ACTO|nr:Putative peptidoglycan binding domain-containing protein [Actinomyces denticolens]
MNDAVTSPDEATAALEALHAATPDHAAEEAEAALAGDAPAEAAPEEDEARDSDGADGIEAGSDGSDRAADDDHGAGGPVPDSVLPADAAIAASALAIATAADRIGVALPEAVVPGEPVEGTGTAADGAERADDEGTPSDAPTEDGGAEAGEAEDAVAGSAEPTDPAGVSDAAVAAAALGVVAAATRAVLPPASADTPEDAADGPEAGAEDESPAAAASADPEAAGSGDAEEPTESAADGASDAPGDAVAAATGAATAARPSLTLPETATPEIATEEVDAGADADAEAGAADRSGEDEDAGRPAALLALARGSVRNPRHLMIAAAALIAVAWLGSAIWTTQALADGSTVGGVSVGGMSPSEARSAVEQSFAESLAQPVTVTAGDKSAQITPADSGVSVDAGSSVGRLTGFTLNPLTIIDRLGGDSVPAATSVDSAALTRSLNSHLGELSSGTVNAEISLQGTKPVVSPSRSGAGVDVEASVNGLSSDWPLGSPTIALVEGTTSPAVTDEQAQSYADTVIAPVLSAPVTVTADGATTAAPASGALTLSPQQLAPMLRISSETGELSTTLDPDALRQAVVAAMGPQIERAAVESGWTIEGRADATPQYVAPVDGLAIDTTALSTGIITTGSAQAGASQRAVVLPMTASAPSSTTAEEDWGIKEIVGEYTTPYYEDAARTQNLVAGAAALNGEIVMPGATFSTNDSLEPVDAEHGFTFSGVILDGVHTEAFGGGLSQIGTTVFNAGYEAGMDDVEHHPHSYWFERYPAGREATLWSPEKDVKFANSTPYPALIQAWVVDGEVHVRLWSTHYYDVSIVSGEKEGYTPIGTVNRSGPRCEPYGGGEGGFSITVTRSRTAPDGTVAEDALHTTYEPDNAVTCSGGGAPAQPSSAQAGQPRSSGGSSQTSAQGQQAPSGGSSPDSAAADPVPPAEAAPAEPQAQAAPPAAEPAPKSAEDSADIAIDAAPPQLGPKD